MGRQVVSYSYSTGGASSNLGHSVQYYFDWGDGTNSGWLAAGATTSSHSWSASGTYSVKAMARCASHTSVQSNWSGSLTATISVPETVSAPSTPSGTASGAPGVSYSYSTGGASSNLGHSVQYYFDWGDGTNSGWLAAGATTSSHSWSASGTYSVKAMARCASHTSVQSNWSGSLTATISVSETVSTPSTPSGDCEWGARCELFLLDCRGQFQPRALRAVLLRLGGRNKFRLVSGGHDHVVT